MAEQKDITVSAKTREGRGKNDARRARRAGMVPISVYGGEGGSVAALAPLRDLAAILRSESGRNTIFTLDIEGVGTSEVMFHERQIDLAFARLAKDPVHGRLTEELNAEVLFNDRYALVVGTKSKWARRKLGLADLVNEPWIMTPLDALGDSFLGGAFRRRGLKLPSLVITTFSVHLRNNLVGSGQFITALPQSVLQIYRSLHALKELPIDLSVQSPVAIVTLRNRTLSPVVQLFIQCAREVAQGLPGRQRSRKI